MPRTTTDRPLCGALLAFASEQLGRAQHTTVNLSHIIQSRRIQNAALIVCLHDGKVYYQPADPHARHLMHGDWDRQWQALQVIHQMVLRTGWHGPTRCFQHSMRDDQKQNIFGWGDGFGLPAMLYHYETYPTRVASSGGGGESSSSSVPPNELPINKVAPAREGATWQAVSQRPRFLWPEHNYFGELVRGLPPTPAFRTALQGRMLPWARRADGMRYRGSSIGLTRAQIMSCAGASPQQLSALGAERGERLRRFFEGVADFGRIGWTAGGSLQHGKSQPSVVEPSSESSSEGTTTSADRVDWSWRTVEAGTMEAGRANAVGSASPKPSSTSHQSSQGRLGSSSMATHSMATHSPGTMMMGNLAAYGAVKHALWLPGGEDWSSALNRLMATGAALYMPSDMGASHSLNTLMLLERCRDCVIRFRRTGQGHDTTATATVAEGEAIDYPALTRALHHAPPLAPSTNRSVCDALAEAFRTHEPRAEAYARALQAFVRDELHSDCVLRYMRAIIDGLPQTVLDAEVAAYSFRLFDCRSQRDFASTLARRGNGLRAALDNFDAWFDVECALREAVR